MSVGFTSSIFNAFNSNIPPAIADMGGQSIEGPVNQIRITPPQAAPVPSSKTTSSSSSIQSQATQGANGQNPPAPNSYSMNPIMMRTSPKRIHSVIKAGLPSIGNLYNPSLPGKKGK